MLVWFTENVSIPVMAFLGRLFSKTPIAVGEAAVIATVVYLLAKAVFLMRRRNMKALLFSVLRALGLYLCCFALIWLPIAGRASLYASVGEYNAADLEKLCFKLLSDANEQYKYYDYEAAVDTEKVADAVFRLTGRKPVIKKSMYPSWMRAFNLAGICLPWSGEAIVRGNMPKLALPFVAAHESAHQIGYGPEAEANYIAYKALQLDEKLSYGASMYALYYSMNALRNISASGFNEVISHMSGVRLSDYAILSAFSSVDTNYGVRVNEAFLRFSGQPGLDSYNRMVDFLLSNTQIK